MTMPKTCRAFLPALALLVAVIGCSNDKKATPASGDAATTPTASAAAQKRIVFLNNLNSPYWDTFRAGMIQAEKDLKLNDKGFTAVMEVNDGTVQGQIDKLRQFAQQGDVAAVAISPLDANNPAIAAELKNLREKGIPVICVDNDLARDRFRDARQFYIGTDNFSAGEVLGSAIKKLKPEGGEYVQFVGKTGAQNAKERMDGVTAALKDKWKEQGRMADDADRTRARENVRNAVRNFPKVNALVGIWSYNGPAIADMVKELQKPEILAVTFDAEKLTIDKMAQGNLQLLVVQNPYAMGEHTVKLLNALINKDDKLVKEMFPNAGKPEGDIYGTDIRVVVPAGSPLLKDNFDGKAKVLTLDDLKKWLAERKVEST